MSDQDLIAKWAAEAVVSAKKAGRDVEDAAIQIIESRACQHLTTTIAKATRTVECKGCGVRLDPFWVLFEYAKRERQFVASSDFARRERDRVHKEVEELKKERASLKAQVRRGKAKP